MVELKEITYESKHYTECIPLNAKIQQCIANSNIKNGMVFVITKHTTTGITINENLECLCEDMLAQLAKLFPEDEAYYHARFLQSYGAMANNPTGHLKAMVTGNHAAFPILEGNLVLGSAQEIYLAEFDGPQSRTIMIVLIGEESRT